MRDPVTPHAAQSWGRAAYDAYAEGLYTYCLSILRDRSAAGSSLRSTFVLADRHIGRLPDLGLLKPWLYALARYECLVRLGTGGPAASTAPDAPADAHPAAPGPAADLPPVLPLPAPREPDRARDDPALLAWPESAGLEPEQREALDLAVRHGLDARGLAAVLGWEESHARRVLLAAGREVDRTRAALAGARAALGCPDGSGLAADVALPGIRARLVAHVDACARCRPHARLAAARLAPTTGPAASPGTLPLITPPAGLRTAVLGDMGRGRYAHRPAELPGRVAKFDHAGFPLPAPGTGRRRRDRSRMTLVVTVVATVATVPAMVLWQAATQGDRRADRATTISAAHVASVAPEPGSELLDPGQPAAPTDIASPGSGSVPQPAAPAVPPSAGPAQAGQRAEPRGTATTPVRPEATAPGPSASTAPVPTRPPAPVAPAPAVPQAPPVRPYTAPEAAADHRTSALVVHAAHDGDHTVITLRNTGAVSVAWTAEPSAAWLRPSKRAGSLAPGATDMITVHVDSAAAPSGSWSANILIRPGGSRVWIEGSTGGGTPAPTTKPTAKPAASGRPPGPPPTMP